jgi:hypothetical protein
MAILQIEYRTSDFAGWKAMFDSDPMGRELHGVTSAAVYQDAADPSHVMVSLEFATTEKAAAFRDVLQPVWDVSGARRSWIIDAPTAASDEQIYFMYKLTPPRPSFLADMTSEEADIMGRHAEYWTGVVNSGDALVFAPVADPAGTWGIAVVRADTEDDVRALGDQDPAITSKMATYDVYSMPGAVARANLDVSSGR